MSDITIPPQALEAAARAQYAAWVKLESAATGMHVGDFEWWEGLGKDGQDEWLQQARAACIAMLRAWPGMHEIDHRVTANNEIVSFSVVLPIILPLPQEASDE